MKDNKDTSTFVDELIDDQVLNDTNYRFDEPEESYESLYVPPIPLESTTSNPQEDQLNLELNDDGNVTRNMNNHHEEETSQDEYLIQPNCSNHTQSNEHQYEASEKPKTIPLIKTSDNQHDSDSTSVEPITSNSLNKIVANLVDLFDELDTLSQKTNESNVLSILSFVQERIIEILCVNGCSLISDLTGFQPDKHKTKQFAIIQENTPIKNIVRNGLSFNGKTIIKAIVEV